MDKKLFQEFPPISTQAWEEIIQKDLKGADYEKRLVWKTNEGFSLQPYYRSENLKELDYLETNLGEFPYVRGVNIDNIWEIRQDIKVKDVASTNKLAHKLIKGGVTSLGFIIDNEINEKDFAALMQGINPEKIAINFISNTLTGKYVSMLALFATKNGYNTSKITGSNDFDSLGYLLINGNTYCGSENCKCAESMLKEYGKNLSSFRLVSVNAKHFKNAGSSSVQELAFGFAMGVEYLRRFLNEGFTVDDIAPKLQFNFAAGTNYFIEIAKIRAARLLWAKIVEANNPAKLESAKIFINTETSLWNKTVYDPYVNMLRSTTEAMSAILGGTNSLNVNPFDSVFADQTEFSLRIARNTQIIIKEEAHFDKVSDPGAGSYYIENITASIVENAWNLFLCIEEKGGFVAALKEGFIQSEIEKMAAKRNKDIETRREIILGTNQYPNFNELLQDIEPRELYTPKDKPKLFKPIKLYRSAEAFEKLRLTTDKSGKRPLAFMLTIGNLNFRKARAQFSCNFFACAGFEVIDNNGFTSIEEGIKAAQEKNADIIVLCSSDEEYASMAVEAFEKIGDEILIIAGNPENRKDLESKGITNFIHARSNVLEDLKNYQKLVGIN
ncbi:MAG: methylmalonyl-CoA mutase family protein [Bacteroidales bacterium]|nr:methylmalonyl-CoA mutase family protein [Bacteroidales bacterium]MDD4216471.1 methylmalonyl-CoA mutase family protein [Bacteroidales bacterium]MDY0141811.1 methylmalonyl-CoA mutase family protein [Bacteroidales bacterium]